MKQSIKKFLELKGKPLVFLSKNGVYYIAIKPVCEAIGVDYVNAYKNLKEDPILGPALSKQTMQVPGDVQSRALISLPERYIYGWIFSLRSDSEGLLEYKMECYNILYDHFHGTITKRKELLKRKAQVQIERSKLELELRNDTRYNDLEKLKAEEARLGISLKKVDEEDLDQEFDLFSSAGVDLSN